MTTPRSIAAALALGSAALVACEGRDRVTAAREQSRRAMQAAAAARDAAALAAAAPEAVAASLAKDGGEPAPVRTPVRSPADAAAALREAAAKVPSSAAAGDPKSGASGQALAARAKLGALLLEVSDLDRIAAAAEAAASDASECRSAAAMLEAAPGAGFGRRLDLAKANAAEYGELRAQAQSPAARAKEALAPVDARIAEARSGADRLDGEVLELRGRAAVSGAESALPLVNEARRKLDEAQAQRREAAEADRESEGLRSEVRVAERAFGTTDEGLAYLEGRVGAAQKAAAAERQDAAKQLAGTLLDRAKERGAEFRKLIDSDFADAVKRIEEAFQGGGLPAKAPADVALVAMAKARVAVLRADAVRLAALAEGTRPTPEDEARRAALLGEAKVALAEANDALGSEGTDAVAKDAVARMAAALSIDLAKPAAPAPDAPPAEAPAPVEPAADAAPEAAPADPAGAEGAPAAPPAEPEESPKA